LKVWLKIHHVRAYNFGISGSNLTQLYQALWRKAGVIMWVQLLEEVPPTKFIQLKTFVSAHPEWPRQACREDIVADSVEGRLWGAEGTENIEGAKMHPVGPAPLERNLSFKPSWCILSVTGGSDRRIWHQVTYFGRAVLWDL